MSRWTLSSALDERGRCWKHEGMEPAPSEPIPSSKQRAPFAQEYAAEPKAVTGVVPKAAASDAARRMGRARTEAKRLAARQNARRGGRPLGYVVSEETRHKISQTKREQAKMKKSEDKA